MQLREAYKTTHSQIFIHPTQSTCMLYSLQGSYNPLMGSYGVMFYPYGQNPQSLTLTLHRLPYLAQGSLLHKAYTCTFIYTQTLNPSASNHVYIRVQSTTRTVPITYVVRF